MLEGSDHLSPFLTISREDWARLAPNTELPLTDEEVKKLAGLGDPIDLKEVDAIYRPVSKLIEIYVQRQRQIAKERRQFLSEPETKVPFVVGIAGSVAVGKSSIARALQRLLQRFDQTPKVDLVTTDGFLLPNKELEERGLLGRKGFPDSYDRHALLRFLAEVKSGQQHVQAPVYSHVIYDVVPNEFISIDQPDILIVEGINVLQPPRINPHSHQPTLAVSDYFDFSIFIDAHHQDVESWYVDRFLSLREGAFRDKDSFFRAYADLDDEAAVSLARQIWTEINLVNFVQNIRPTRSRADLIIHKASDHRVSKLLLRKL
ncbi:type I pantothenate kinase [Boudabousia liubingyangii]|uniref:Pantothenate kinase n=1 Tax=Boudabousia liubingyangii TaxID=1921764 RepID=A0A1Q5PQX8_9ACTO|nr:type I pantothenate kinase [Boudabousia liubingyangii]OKL49879.1 type I pantothenate kinase [Boudabousia liubingyangii]